jgi:hypothetical protein
MPVPVRLPLNFNERSDRIKTKGFRRLLRIAAPQLRGGDRAYDADDNQRNKPPWDLKRVVLDHAPFSQKSIDRLDRNHGRIIAATGAPAPIPDVARPLTTAARTAALETELAVLREQQQRTCCMRSRRLSAVAPFTTAESWRPATRLPSDLRATFADATTMPFSGRARRARENGGGAVRLTQR